MFCWSRSLTTVSAALLWASLGSAEATPPPAQEPHPVEQPSADLQQQLEKALKQDQQSQNAQKPAEPPPSVPLPQSITATRAFQSLNPDISFIADFALAAFHGTPFQPGGHDPKHNGFNLQAAEIAMGAAVDPYFRFDANLAFGPDGTFELEEAYATTLALPANLQIRAGKFLTRFGRMNQQHPHTWDFVDEPLVLAKFLGPDGNRGPGLEVSALLSFIPWYTEVVLSGNSPDLVVNPAGPSGVEPPSLFRASEMTRSPLDVSYVGALKQFFAISDDVSLAWGLSTLQAPNSLGSHGRTSIYGTDIYLKYRPVDVASYTIVSLTAELMYRHRYDVEGFPGTPSMLNDAGGYAQLFWRFAQRWGTGLRYEVVTGAANDPVDVAWARPHHRASMAFTFWPTEFSRLRLEGDYLRSLDAPASTTTALFLAFEFAAGAHGAHAF